jgi:hypothetical protein
MAIFAKGVESAPFIRTSSLDKHRTRSPPSPELLPDNVTTNALPNLGIASATALGTSSDALAQ